MPENGNKYLSLKVLLGALATMLFILVTGLIADTRQKVDDLQREKVDMARYCQDISDIKAGINDLVKMHMKE